MKLTIGHYLFGVASIGFGVCSLASNDVSNWQQEATALGISTHNAILSYIVAAVQILGGLAVLWPRTARTGAAALASLWFIFALMGVPSIFNHPLVYNEYNNIFEQFSFVSGALILYAYQVRARLNRHRSPIFSPHFARSFNRTAFYPRIPQVLF